MNRSSFHLLDQGSRANKMSRAKQLRQRMTPAELAFWKQLRRRRDHEVLHFRRQVVIAGYVADFYCSEHKLVVELDGAVHTHQQEYDQHRDQAMRQLGLRVVRLSNEDVLRDPASAVAQVVRQVRSTAG